jgi:hypothetical protein
MENTGFPIEHSITTSPDIAPKIESLLAKSSWRSQETKEAGVAEVRDSSETAFPEMQPLIMVGGKKRKTVEDEHEYY